MKLVFDGPEGAVSFFTDEDNLYVSILDKDSKVELKVTLGETQLNQLIEGLKLIQYED